MIKKCIFKFSVILISLASLLGILGCTPSISYVSASKIVELGEQAMQMNSAITIEYIGHSRDFCYVEYRFADKHPKVYYTEVDSLPMKIREKINNNLNPFPNWFDKKTKKTESIKEQNKRIKKNLKEC